MTFDLKRKDPRFTKLSITVDMYRSWIMDENGMKQGLTRFRMFSTDALDDNDELLGKIGGGMGAVTLNKGDDEWTIHHDDLWYAFTKALEKLDEEKLGDEV